MSIHLCPVCRQHVKTTMKGNISAHLDSLRADTCPGGGQPFRITVMVTREFQGVSA